MTLPTETLGGGRPVAPGLLPAQPSLYQGRSQGLVTEAGPSCARGCGGGGSRGTQLGVVRGMVRTGDNEVSSHTGSWMLPGPLE